MSAEAAAKLRLGPQGKEISIDNKTQLGTYSFSITERFLFRGSLVEAELNENREA